MPRRSTPRRLVSQAAAGSLRAPSSLAYRGRRWERGSSMGVYQSARARPGIVAQAPRGIAARHLKPARVLVAGASVGVGVATALLDDALLTTRRLFALAR